MASAYVLAQLVIHDRDRYSRYTAQFMQTLDRFSARLLAADESAEVLEGSWPYKKVVLLEFRDREEADRWMSSPEYQRISADRKASTTAAVLCFRSLHPWHGTGE